MAEIRIGTSGWHYKHWVAAVYSARWAASKMLAWYQQHFGYQSPLRFTADIAYTRLHGAGGKYQGSYDDKALGAWARRFKQWRHDLTAIYVYFDDDDSGDVGAMPSDCASLSYREEFLHFPTVVGWWHRLQPFTGPAARNSPAHRKPKLFFRNVGSYASRHEALMYSL
jgi:hypothetical protein